MLPVSDRSSLKPIIRRLNNDLLLGPSVISVSYIGYLQDLIAKEKIGYKTQNVWKKEPIERGGGA